MLLSPVRHTLILFISGGPPTLLSGSICCKNLNSTSHNLAAAISPPPFFDRRLFALRGARSSETPEPR